MTDVIVVGGGPAGLTAALYALRNGKTVTVLEKHGLGGQITYSPKVENWPGTLQMSGNEFAYRLLDQIIAQGGEIVGHYRIDIENLPVLELQQVGQPLDFLVDGFTELLFLYGRVLILGERRIGYRHHQGRYE